MVIRIKKRKRGLSEKIFLVLIVLVLVLGSLNIAKAKGWLIPQQKFEVKDGVVDLSSMSLEQKIAQMVIVHGGLHNLHAWKNMQVGGIHLFALQNGELYKEIIDKFQEEMEIPFFVTVDLEGCWNPFANFKQFVAVSEINSTGEAFEKGSDEGKFLSGLGFNVNYAPVVDLNDEIWKCRSFPGDEKRIGELAEAYILGLQSEGVIATAKHYPGKTLVVKDPHKFLVVATIAEEDLYPYNYLVEKGEVGMVMVSHIIVSGAVDSEGYPSVVSKEVIKGVKEGFKGLIVSDEVNMLGLKDYYLAIENMYVDLVVAGNDLIINFNEDPNEIWEMILRIKEAVERGEISEEQINNSVRKILIAKGLTVIES